MGEAPKRIWTGACGKAIVQSDMNRWPGDVEYVRADLAEAAFLDGVKAGLEAAAEAAKTAAGTGLKAPGAHEAARQIRALDPVAIARAAQKEGGS